MAVSFQNRKKNAESHLFGDEPPPEHYEISPETIQGLQDANNNRRRAMDSHLFDDTPSQAQPRTNENMNKNMESHLSFGSDQNTKTNNNNNVDNNNTKPRYQAPQMPSSLLKPKLQPLPEPVPKQPVRLPPMQQQAQQPIQQQQGQRPNYNAPPPVQLNENLSRIDNSLPVRSGRKFGPGDQNYNDPNYRGQNNNNQQQNPSRAGLVTPHRPTFLDAPVKRATLPSYDGLIQNSSVPMLTPFPNFDFEVPPIENNFSFAVKPLTSSGQRNHKKLNVYAGNEMKKMRDDLEKDTAQFEGRIKGIEKVELVEPRRPVTAVEDDPPTLDFSFASPRLTTESDFVYLSPQEMGE